MKEVPWTKLFAYDGPAEVEVQKAKKCRCGNESCKRAKHIRCVCGCHAENHGMEQRRGMEPLDRILGLETEISRGSEQAVVPWIEIC